MSHQDPPITLDSRDATAVWEALRPGAGDQILARAAFERVLRDLASLEDKGLYFRPGGWSVSLSAPLARLTVAAAILAGGFQIAGLEDLDREVIIATASIVAAIEYRPVRPTKEQRKIAERLRAKGLIDVPISSAEARQALAKKQRRQVGRDEVAAALDALVRAGVADRDGADWLLRAEGNEAWLRLSFRRNDA
jgi:hypothetical protein